MKTRVLCFIVICLFATGCSRTADDSAPGLHRSASSSETESPLQQEYELAWRRGLYYLGTASSMKESNDQPRGDGMMHSEVARECPDRYRMRITGAVDMERVIVGESMYERRNGGAWVKSTVHPPVAELSPCRSLESRRKQPAPDEATVLAGSMFSEGVNVEKGTVREYLGVKCQEYTVTRADQSLTTCYAVDGIPYLVATTRGKHRSITYDLNKPVHIEAPHTEAADSRAR